MRANANARRRPGKIGTNGAMKEPVECAAARNVPGEMAERSKAHAWKVCRGSLLSWVRIPLSPPEKVNKINDIYHFIAVGDLPIRNLRGAA